MNRGGVFPAYHPTAWIYLASGDCTIRWQRGDNVAYILAGEQLNTYPDEALRVTVLDTILVPSTGWTDIAQVRLVGENWIRAKRKRCQTCRRVYS
jgi:hypothetical protein